MSKEKKHHIPMRSKPFSVPEMFQTGDGFWGDQTPFGYVTAHFNGGEIVRVEIDGKLFVPAADDEEVEPVGWSGWACHKMGNMPRLYGDKGIAELNCDTANGESLVFLSAHPAQPRNEEIAADLEAWLSQVRHMEGLSARDIVESAEIYIAQLRASQQEGGEG